MSIPMTIGEYLKEKRLELGLSLEDVSNEIKISIKILEKIENNDSSHGIAPALLKGFVRTYIKHLKLDPNSLPLPEEKPLVKEKKTDLELLESGEEASPVSWLKWAFTGGSLILLAVGVKLLQKYSAEKYVPPSSEESVKEQEFPKAGALSEEVSLESIPTGETPPSSLTPTLESPTVAAVDPVTPPLPAVTNTVTAGTPPPSPPVLSKPAAASFPEAQSVVLQSSTIKEKLLGGEKQVLVEKPMMPEKPLAVQKPLEGSPSLSSPDSLEPEKNNLTKKEIILEVKKSTTIQIKSSQGLLVDKALEAGRLYLFKQASPFQIKGIDGSALKVIVGGRILHQGQEAGQAFHLDVK
jgi:cytoskeletal protein RodZ